MLFVLLLLSPFLVRGWHLAQVPEIADPFDVEAFLSETVDDKDNAFVDYHAARALLVPESSLTSEERQELDSGWEKTSPSVRAWVDANLPALNRWRIGTEKTEAIDGDLRNDPWLALPEVAPARDLSQLAWLQGEREQSEGHMAEAWQWYRAAVRFSRHVAQRKDWIGRTLGCSLYRSTAKRIVRWASDSRTNDEQLQLALKQIKEDYRLTQPLSEILKVEYCDLPKYAQLDDDGKSPFTFGPTSADWRDWRFIRYCRGQPELTIRWKKLVIENWLCGCDFPRSLQHRISSSKGFVLDVTAPGSGISGMDVLRMREFAETGGGTSFNQIRDSLDTELARQEALRLTLACQRWFRRHGEFPARLEDLVPATINELPVDPFGKASEMFRYRHDGEEAVVYSLGSDEKDDLGSVDLIPGKDYPDIGYRLLPPSNGEQVSDQKPSDEP